VNWSAVTAALVPPAVTTSIFTVPLPAGETAVMLVPEFIVKLVAAILPKLTAVAPVKLLPVTVTEVPPAAGPLEVLTLVTVGAGTA
jgi:hypothetical protein